MATLGTIFSLDNPAYNAYIFYCGVLALKMLIMSPLTGRQRFNKGVFANLEDTKLKPGSKMRVDDDVERVRRAHLNDLENIPVFMIVCGLYLLTGPAASTAVNLMRIFTLARIVHTLVYAVVVVPQPARAISWGVAYGVTIYMSFKVVMHFMTYM